MGEADRVGCQLLLSTCYLHLFSLCVAAHFIGHENYLSTYLPTYLCLVGIANHVRGHRVGNSDRGGGAERARDLMHGTGRDLAITREVYTRFMTRYTYIHTITTATRPLLTSGTYKPYLRRVMVGQATDDRAFTYLGSPRPQ